MFHHQMFFVLGKVSANSIAVLGACCHRAAAFCSVCLVLILLSPALGIAADKKTAAVGLEEYLKSLKYGAVPFIRDVYRQSMVQGKIGTKKLVLSVDTGQPRTTLDSRVSKDLKTLNQLGVTLQDTYFGEINESRDVVIEKLALGQAQFLNQPAKVEDFKAHYTTVDHDGILGTDFLLRNHCLYDFGSSRLFFRAGKLSEEESSNLSQTLTLSGFIEVPIEWTGLWVVKATVNGELLRLVLHTGSEVTLLDETLVKRLALKPMMLNPLEGGSFIQAQAGLQVLGGKSMGRHEVYFVRLDQFKVGSREWKKTKCGVVNLKPWTGDVAARAPQVDGMLGRDFFETQRALMDLPGRKLWLAPEIKRKQ